MKAKRFLIALSLCCIYFATSLAQNSVSKEDALAIVKNYFNGKDVDYYLLSDNNMTVWTIFIDAEPMKGWKHDCYIAKIPKNPSIQGTLPTPPKLIANGLPPAGSYKPLSVKNRYGTNSKPSVPKTTVLNESKETAKRTYAVILSGGISPISNYERYWNDCSFIYQTLVNKYGVPKENIFPIMADGDNPAVDMYSISGGFKSQPLDLDNDNVADIKLAATKENVKSTLTNLSNKLQKDDHLFFFVIDHGGTTDNNTNSYICLWGTENLYDHELANMLKPFSNKSVNINVVLGQCYSGGFVDNLKMKGCVVSTASKGSEPSWACSDIPYDEFVYHWTSAMNGANHNGVVVQADTDNNGKTTVKEAFDYAKKNDRRTQENPQYQSTPISVGEDLAFNHLAPAVDIYVKDNPEDTGKEPNTTTDMFWKSPSICVRNQDDGIFEHQNPEYSSDHQMAFVYVRVYNRGKEKFSGEGQWVIVYWAQASTGFSSKTWKGRETFENKYPTGGNMEAVPIPAIEPGDSATVRIRWALPTLLETYPEGNFHFCLLAKIMDTPYDDGYTEGKRYFNLPGSNDQAQRNITIIRKKDTTKGFNVYVRNTSNISSPYTLELVPQTASDALLFSKAKVEMEMSPKIHTAWVRGGSSYQSLELPAVNSTGAALRTVKFISPQSKLKNISLNANEFDVVKLKFNFTRYESTSSTYTFDLIQRDKNGNIVGGETFIVESPGISSRPVTISSEPTDNGQVQLSVDDPNFESVKWINEKGETLGDTETITVTPKINNDSYSVIAMTEEGDVATESISLKDGYGIKTINASTGTDCLIVDLLAPAPNNSTISAVSLLEGETKILYNIPENSTSVSINVSDISKGLYIVSYSVDSEIIDQKRINL